MEVAGLFRLKWWNDRKATSSRRAGAAFQASMASFSQFLENFSGIAEIAKAADQQYGGLAFGTLSVMLSVFVHETQRGFCLSIIFARETTEYYISRARRINDAILPEQKKNATLIEIRKKLSEIRNECDVLMLTRITALHRKLESISIDLRETHEQTVRAGAQLRRARHSSDTSHLAELRQILGVHDLSPHVSLDKYKTLLESAVFPGRLRSSWQRPKEISMEFLRADETFEKWWESTQSCVLLTGGTNFVNDYSSGSLNWLSYGAILAVEELRQKELKVAFFLAQTSFAIRSRKRCTIQDIIVNLIYQLSEMHTDLLRSETDRLKEVVQSPTWRNADTDLFWHKAQPLLLEIFSAFSKEEVIILVVDRLDQCAWQGEEDDDLALELRGPVAAHRSRGKLPG
ncbi:hypothetical protein TI39_contig5847g00009 [Zymoseptoria brevis]|uniref:Nephrocystin 3-like N-terminal domain-containing protein n=1 Tax=Zymoseptoria brevis TaxID=1047168 RepID=A0A0F4G628_9PEZI|nr:hypothetical protein TI39_contig5847g00009 [Zymoseptoria brevis]